MFKATRKNDNHSVAIKESIFFFEKLDVDTKQGLKDEIANMKAFPHPLMVKLIDDFIDSAGH